jgi:hypothetical protein
MRPCNVLSFLPTMLIMTLCALRGFSSFFNIFVSSSIILVFICLFFKYNVLDCFARCVRLYIQFEVFVESELFILCV